MPPHACNAKEEEEEEARALGMLDKNEGLFARSASVLLFFSPTTASQPSPPLTKHNVSRVGAWLLLYTHHISRRRDVVDAIVT